MPKPRRLPSVAAQLSRYNRRDRAAVAYVASRHPRLADLAVSFPALLYALAVRRKGVEAEAIVAWVIAGRPLDVLAAKARLPTWTRKLPPESFKGPIPDLPDGELFRRQIANHIPAHPSAINRWLSILAFAGRWSGDAFAIWSVQNFPPKHKKRDGNDLGLLSLWSWYSLRQDLTASRFIDCRWAPQISFGAALNAAEAWVRKLDIDVLPRAPLFRECRFTAMSVDGHEFVPLSTAADIAAEGEALDNCLGTYDSYDLHTGLTLWSVRRQGERIAALSLRHSEFTPLPSIQELKAKSNDEAHRDVWIAAAKWLVHHDLVAQTASAPAIAPEQVDRATWQELWLPYWLERKSIPCWLPTIPGEDWRWRLRQSL